MRFSGAMTLFLAVFFLWQCIEALFLCGRSQLDRRERVWFFVYATLCALGVVLFAIGSVYEIVRLVRMYG